jgi:hypothetical protein
MRRFRWLAPAASLLLSATAYAQSVRDSSGIRIIENPARASAPVEFRLGMPVVDIGGASDIPDQEFNKGLGLGSVVLSDGSLMVPDRVRLQYFDSAGRPLAIVGRSGAGPDEFKSLNPRETCRTRGDTLVVGDVHNGRFTVIHGRHVVRSVSYKDDGGTIEGCFDDGTILLTKGLPGLAPTFTVHLTRVALDGKVINRFAPIVFRSPVVESWYVNPSVVVGGQYVYAGDGATSEVLVYRADGQLTRIIRTADQPAKVTDADIQRVRRPATGPRRPIPETHPAYSRLVVDPAGRLWIQDFNAVRAPSDGWTCFDANGRLVGRLEIPRQGAGTIAVVSFEANTVQAYRADDDGFLHVAFYRLDRVR